MDEKTIEMAVRTAKTRINHVIDTVLSDMLSHFPDEESTSAINWIENGWEKFRLDTDNIYSDLIGELMKSVNEKEIISSKKENTKRKG